MNEDFIESVFVKIFHLGKSVIIGSCYRLRNSNYDMFNTFIENKISSIRSGSVNIVMCGDFNLDRLTMSEEGFDHRFMKA